MFFKKYNRDQIDDVQKIGVIMFGLMGDVLIRTPVLRALKDIFPEAILTVFVDPIGKQVLQSNRYVDEIVVAQRKKEKNKIKQNLKKFKTIVEVRKRRFDLLVNLYNAGTSRLMIRFSGARYTLGFCLPENKRLYNVRSECDAKRMQERQSLYNYMISIVEPLSTKSYSLKPDFELDENSLQTMKQYLDSFSYSREKIYLLNLGASKEDKILEYEKYLFMVEYIYEHYGYIPAIVCNPSQEYLQERFIYNYLNDTDTPCIKLKKLPLVDIASLICLTKFFITPDTGLMHLAMAFDNPIMAVFTYTHPLLVDIQRDKFFALYEAFDDGKLYQRQDISKEIIEQKIDMFMTQFFE